jgi:hypothetical protein
MRAAATDPYIIERHFRACGMNAWSTHLGFAERTNVFDFPVPLAL